MRLTIPEQLAAAERHFHTGRLEDAARILGEVIAVDPTNGEALEGLAYIAASRQEHAAAADYFEQAVQHLPATPARHHEAGIANQAAGRHARALTYFERALVAAPQQVPTLHAAAMSCAALDDHARATELLSRAVRISPQTWQLHYNLGRALGMAGRYDDEIAAYQRAIALKPDSVEAHVNLGVALRDMHQFDDALKQFKKAVSLNPNDANARTNRAQTNLLLGVFEHGWREYEWRWRDGGQRHPFGPDAWLGESPVAGKTVLVHAEQGFGDTLQFVRYVDALAAQGARIVLRVQDALQPLLATTRGVAHVIGEHEAVPPFDLHCPLMSLPLALAKTVRQIPADIPYLQADAARAAQWRQALEAMGARRPRIGIAWSGRTTHLNDRNRSMRLEDWRPLFEVDATFVSLQKEVREADRETLDQLTTVHDVSAQIDTFADTAALIAELDLVVCVDTSVAHLAGALGKPVWVLLPFTPDWRWQLGRADSPWYPTMRLFRQTARGNWSDVLAVVREALGTFAADYT